MFESKRYLFAFFITVAIFGTVFWISNTVSERKLAEIQQIEERISIDIASSETQFDLLQEISCKDVGETFLSQELASLAQKLSFMEENRPREDAELLRLKKAYSLLEIKDYLLAQKVGEKCKRELFSILYFYSNEEECADCEKEGIALTHLRKKYPRVRIYSFDYHLELGALQTLIRVLTIQKEFPALVVGDDIYYGYKTLDELEMLVPKGLKTGAGTTTPLLK